MQAENTVYSSVISIENKSFLKVSWKRASFRSSSEVGGKMRVAVLLSLPHNNRFFNELRGGVRHICKNRRNLKNLIEITADTAKISVLVRRRSVKNEEKDTS